MTGKRNPMRKTVPWGEIVLHAQSRRQFLLHLLKKLAAAFDKVIVVGDATKAGTMADATKAAYEKCFYI